MPDRYGERPDPELGDEDDEPVTAEDFGPTRAQLRAIAIRACDLCDEHGYRGSYVCDHEDHRDAAKRGMAAVRAALGLPADNTPPNP
jgi:hypothetical protein